MSDIRTALRDYLSAQVRYNSSVFNLQDAQRNLEMYMYSKEQAKDEMRSKRMAFIAAMGDENSEVIERLVEAIEAEENPLAAPETPEVPQP